MNWPRPCTPRGVLVDEIELTDAQLELYLRTMHARVAEALQAAALVLEESG